MEIELYTTINGKCPVYDFVNTLSPKLKAKVLRSIDLLESEGPRLREPDSKSLANGIFELRTKQSNNTVRICYFFFYGNKAVLTNGFIKKTKKTPQKELALALQYKADYEKRHQNEV